ncbi:hypothetical protein DY000_02048926 [Brassica cretica]|uniref:Uncharacterized protein n=1 Tax=Brassica cretica TaxID=69181 RepID=A0ABQ7F7D0_BRACR|nr:hypothetical protein DY000_02048926 [Brassica cretica]
MPRPSSSVIGATGTTGAAGTVFSGDSLGDVSVGALLSIVVVAIGGEVIVVSAELPLKSISGEGGE